MFTEGLKCRSWHTHLNITLFEILQVDHVNIFLQSNHKCRKQIMSCLCYRSQVQTEIERYQSTSLGSVMNYMLSETLQKNTLNVKI
uniref:Uncharacterized protein n=1 Tax=Setaria italica TaxID=4555 RepID=K3YB85_SETIT